MMETSYKIDEEHIQEVVRLYHERKNAGIRVTVAGLTHKFEVSKNQLQHQLKGIPSKSMHSHTNLRLTDAQYKAIFEYLNQLEDLGTPATPQLLQHATNQILEQHHQDPTVDPPTVSSNWPYQFLKMHSQYNKTTL